MNVTPFGKINANVSSLGFGAMNLPNVPFEQASKALHYALDQGINYIDTAAAYKNSEEIIGQAISGRRSEFFLATKTNKRDYASAKEEIERSLKRLNTDVIDLLQIHYVNRESQFQQIMGEQGAYEAVLEMQRKGYVRYIGITGHRPELLTRWIKEVAFDQVLCHLNLAQPFVLDELIPTAEKLNMGRVTMKPLSGGMIHPFHTALRFPFSQPVHVTISGMVSIEEVQHNLAAHDQPVGAEEQRQLLELARELGGHQCRRCNECSCPQGIKIPDTVILSRIRSSSLGLPPKGEQFMEAMREPILACGAYEPCLEKPLCEAKCPYHIPIKSVMQEAVSYYK